MRKKDRFVFIALLLAFFSLVLAFWFWFQIQKFEPQVYYYVPEERSFIYSPEEISEFGFEEYIEEKITTERSRLIESQKSFIDVNLEEMKISLYQEGKMFQVFSIQSKGKEGSYWQTSPGVYFVGDKVAKHFSSLARVWMPYAIQFYGNFFIHGWPYDSLGRKLPPGPSGGCIRLKTEDAAVVFEFTQRGMPVLVFEKKPVLSFLPALVPIKKEITPPEIKAENFFIADLDTGEIILGKEIYSEIYAGPATFLTLALTASEIVNLERRLIARSWMVEGIKEGIIIPGKSYTGYNLLSLLLSRYSKEAALILTRFFTPDYFLAAMNTKVKAIGMKNTNFEDITGISPNNVTSLVDMAKMMRYIKDYRGFLLDINGQLIGSDESGVKTVFKLQKMSGTSPNNQARSLFIALASSPDLERDLNNITSWLNKNFDLK